MNGHAFGTSSRNRGVGVGSASTRAPSSGTVWCLPADDAEDVWPASSCGRISISTRGSTTWTPNKVVLPAEREAGDAVTLNAAGGFRSEGGGINWSHNCGKDRLYSFLNILIIRKTMNFMVKIT